VKSDEMAAQVIEPLKPTLMKLMAGGRTGLHAAVAILAVHAEEVGAKILNSPMTPVEGIVINRR
jgi:hypothetical protein